MVVVCLYMEVICPNMVKYAVFVFVDDYHIRCLDAYQGAQMNIRWHEIPIEYKPESIQVEGYKMNGINTSNDAVHYTTGGKIYPNGPNSLLQCYF